ncbi:MAG: PspC domain-containing protein, partial [Saprospiraceae bacterium]
DPDDKVVGGVCSGLAAYFGIQDPVWVRLLFVVMLLSGGFGAAIYIALMIIVPYAKTSTDRLAMRGEKIDIENIAKIVEDGFQSVSQKFAEFGTDDEKKKATSGVGGNFSGKIFLSNVFGFLGEVFRALLQTLAKVGRPILIVIGAILIISLIISWLGMLFGFYFSLPFLSYVTPNSGFRSAMGMTNSLVVIAIPILALIFLIVRLAYRTKINSNIKAGMWSFWFINLISLGFVATSFVREFKSRVEVNNSVDLSNVQSDSLLHFTVFKPDVVRESNIQFFDTELYDDALLNRNVYLDIRTSDDDKFHVSEKHIALGANLQEANSLAANISKLVSVQPDQTLSLIPSFLIPKGQKWRAQEVAVTIEVPKGKHLRFGDGFQWQHNGRFELSQKNDEEGVEWHSFENHLWRMEADGLYCVDCERQFSEEAQEVEEK